MGTPDPLHDPALVTAESDPRRWRALAVLAAMQFMLVLDATVVNVSLPKIQHDLSFSRQALSWVPNGYVLVAGGFLLLGGRLADMFGRRRMFLIGVIVFGVTSAACGAAVTSSMLVASRFAQGMGEALAGPAALGMIPLLFSDSRERMKAVGIWGGIGGVGGTLGPVISGLLTDVDWRWIFYINIPVVLFALIMAPRVLPESRMARGGHSIDAAGAITVTGGVLAIVDGILNVSSHSWGSWQVLLPLIGGICLLVIMVAIESRSSDPLVPLRFFNNRTRATSNVLTAALFATFVSYAFMLTLYMQQILGYSPLKTGLAYLPLGLAFGAGIGMNTALMPRLGVKLLLTIGFIGTAAGMFAASYLHADSSYPGGLLAGLIVVGLFTGICLPGLINGALHQVTGQDSGLGSGVQTGMQQVGSALGLSILLTIALRHAADHIRTGTPVAVAQTDGYTLAFRVTAIVLVIAAVLILVLLENVTAQPRTALAEVSPDQVDS
ncbi:MFS transporter [Actinoallomurus soli]|uniref:MFS transporter n=1 Tax=Actinoallomurus soli TaxID=2952535 RepID=UPI002092CCC5|nr:MFS transporter [Actinoallomurus soli]MCO5972522.1 MFS transporter [Actinoallomurus soli]